MQIAPNDQVGIGYSEKQKMTREIHIGGGGGGGGPSIASDYNGSTIILYAHGWREIIIRVLTFPFLKQST